MAHTMPLKFHISDPNKTPSVAWPWNLLLLHFPPSRLELFFFLILLPPVIPPSPQLRELFQYLLLVSYRAQDRVSKK